MTKRPRERGFTLLELMLGLAVALIAATSILGAAIAHQRLYVWHAETLEAQQNARVALDVIRREMSLAGWGLPAATTTGIAPAGTCRNGDPFVCNGIAFARPNFSD